MPEHTVLGFNVVADLCIHKTFKVTLCSAGRMRFLSGWKSSSFSQSELREDWNFSDRQEAIDCFLGCDSSCNNTKAIQKCLNYIQ